MTAWATECDDNGPNQCKSCGHVEHDDGCKNADLSDDLIGILTTWGQNELAEDDYPAEQDRSAPSPDSAEKYADEHAELRRAALNMGQP